MREFVFTTTVSLLLMPALFLGLFLASAQSMQSSNYRIESDSVNFGGGLTTSTNYSLESTGGEIATGDASSASYKLKAGYQQMHGSYIAMSGGDAVVLAPSIPGITGGIANGSTTVTVITDSAAGYQLTIAASQNPAMQKGGDTIADYTPIGNPDFTFATAASDAHLGYSPTGVDIASRFKDDGADCGVGSGDVELACWDGLSTSDVLIAESAGPNQPAGATTTINFRVGIGGSVNQAPGAYTATTTLTALSL